MAGLVEPPECLLTTIQGHLAIKQISYSTMFFLPASPTTTIRHERQVNSVILVTFAQYLRLFTIWIITAFQSCRRGDRWHSLHKQDDRAYDVESFEVACDTCGRKTEKPALGGSSMATHGYISQHFVGLRHWRSFVFTLDSLLPIFKRGHMSS